MIFNIGGGPTAGHPPGGAPPGSPPSTPPAGSTLSGLLRPDRDYQREAIDRVFGDWTNGHKSLLLVLPTGCHRAGEHVLRYDGSSVAAEDVVVGEQLMGPDSSPRTVLLLCRGEGRMMSVKPTKGQTHFVNDEHVLSVHVNSGSVDVAAKVVDLTVNDYLKRSKWFQHCSLLYRAPVFAFQGEATVEQLPIDPYFLGLYIADGTMCRAHVGVSKPDPEVKAACEEQAATYGLTVVNNQPADKCPTWSIIGAKKRQNPLLNRLRVLGLMGISSDERFVPDTYRTSTWQARTEVLAGLLDGDGHLSGGGFDFISKSKRLADDVVFIARSLGLAAYSNMCRKSCQGGFTETYWRVSVSGDLTILPIRIKRKVPPPRAQKKNVLRTGFTVSTVSEHEPYYGFVLDGDHRYLTDDFTVFHNSGKTIVSADIIRRTIQQTSQKTIFMAHRAELLNQSRDKIHLVAPQLSVGIVQAQKDNLQRQVTIASVQTLMNATRLQRVLQHGPYSLLVIDECFPSGTMVGGTAIEHLRVGSLVPSFDETTGRACQGRVARVFRSAPHGMVRVHFSGMPPVACTPGQTFFTSRGWVAAGLLTNDDAVLGTANQHEEDDTLEWTWVDRVEVLEQSGDGTFGGVCPDGFVYNLEVAGTHTYVAGGHVVHNCHHAASPSWMKVIHQMRMQNPAMRILGLTATPGRSDGIGLDGLFEKISYTKSTLELINEKWLVYPRAFRVSLNIDLDVVGTKSTEGDKDFKDGDLAKLLIQQPVLDATLAAYQKYGDGRTMIGFSVTVEHARLLAETFTRAGVNSSFVAGDTKHDDRQALYADFRSGKLRLLFSCGVLAEGFDEPSAGGVLLARPTMSQSLFIQMVGRGLRPFPMKNECIVIDCAGNTRKHAIVQMSTLAGFEQFDAMKKDEPTIPREGSDERGVIANGTDMHGNEVRITDIRGGTRESTYTWRQTDYGYALMIPKVGYYLVSNDEGDPTTANIRFYDTRKTVDGRPAPPRSITDKPIDRNLAYGLVESEAKRMLRAAMRAANEKRPTTSQHPDKQLSFDAHLTKIVDNLEPLLADGIDDEPIDEHILMCRTARWRDGPRTEVQTKLLAKLGTKVDNMPSTAGEASDLISIASIEKHQRTVKMHGDPATPKQRWFLRTNGIPHENDVNKAEAAKLIFVHKAKQRSAKH